MGSEGQERGGDVAANLLRAMPCLTVLGMFGEEVGRGRARVLAIVSGSPHDRDVLDTARRVVSRRGGVVTLATIEPDVGSGAEALGEKALQHLLHEAAVDEGVETKVVVDNHPVRGVMRCFDGHDAVFIGSSDFPLVRKLGKALGDAPVAAVKRAPPLKRRSLPDWIPQINPTDYAELVQSLRQGSRWNADFIVMLGLASAIASLGLIQNSPAVVIGSMLLAPLMTPMIGLGLALTQANGRLARLAGSSIVKGFFLTLLVSFCAGFLSFRETLSPEILARGGPNLLDLGIALFAAAAASFALARPGIAGAVAGVAIATALVPPVCSLGVSMSSGADARWITAFGAFLLFLTNLLAIVVASSITFSIMGVSVPHSFSRARRRARQAMIALVGLLLLLCIPLTIALDDQLDRGRVQALVHPVTRRTNERVRGKMAEWNDKLRTTEGIEPIRLMLLARSGIEDGIAAYFASEQDLPKQFAREVREVIRESTHRPDMKVHIVFVRSALDPDAR